MWVELGVDIGKVHFCRISNDIEAQVEGNNSMN